MGAARRPRPVGARRARADRADVPARLPDRALAVRPDDRRRSRLVERFEYFVAGMEIGNGYHGDQRRRRNRPSASRRRRPGARRATRSPRATPTTWRRSPTACRRREASASASTGWPCSSPAARRSATSSCFRRCVRPTGSSLRPAAYGQAPIRPVAARLQSIACEARRARLRAVASSRSSPRCLPPEPRVRFFQTPSGNDRLLLSKSLLRRTCRCDIERAGSHSRRGRRSCDLDWGDSLNAGEDGPGEARLPRRHGRRSLREGAAVRDDVDAGRFRCDVRTTGLTCENAVDHGFFLSRQSWRRF